MNKICTDINQSKKLVELGIDVNTADMLYRWHDERWYCVSKDIPYPYSLKDMIPAWSLAALLNVLPEINGILLRIEKVKAKDGYNGYYYHIEYKDIVLIPYSKNPVDACYEMILRLHEQKLL